MEWAFECDNQYIKQRWLSILVQLIGHFQHEEAAIQKYFESLGHGAEMRGW